MLQVRIGIHRGETIRDRDDFFGRTVIVGAHIAAHANAAEILVSEEVRRVATDFEYGPGQEVTLKGLADTYTVYQVTWG